MSGTGARLARRITALLTAAAVLWAASTASAVRFTASGDFGSDT